MVGGVVDPGPNPDPDPIPLANLEVIPVSAGANRYANLTWTGGGESVDVLRGGDVIDTIANEYAYTDIAPKKTSSATYQVCEAGSTADCSITVSASVEPSPLELINVATTSAGANRYATLTWMGGASDLIDVYRDGSLVASTANDSEYTDTAPKKAESATYQVCESGSNTCSDPVTVNW
jgi:hypothetical protein